MRLGHSGNFAAKCGVESFQGLGLFGFIIEGGEGVSVDIKIRIFFGGVIQVVTMLVAEVKRGWRRISSSVSRRWRCSIERSEPRWDGLGFGSAQIRNGIGNNFLAPLE